MENLSTVRVEEVSLPSYNNNGLSIQLFPSKRKKTRKVTMVIEGDVTIPNIKAVKEITTDQLNKNNYVDIVLKNIKNIDLCAIQYFYTLKYFNSSSDKAVSIESEFSGELKELLRVTGLLSLVTKVKLTA